MQTMMIWVGPGPIIYGPIIEWYGPIMKWAGLLLHIPEPIQSYAMNYEKGP